MKLVYDPKHAERREWTFRPDQLPSDEAEAIEEALDLPFGACMGKLLSGSTRAKRAFLWVFLRREQPRLQFDQVRFLTGEVFDDLDDEELANARERIGDLEASDDPLDRAVAESLRERYAIDPEAAAEGAAALLPGVDPGKDSAEPAAAGSST